MSKLKELIETELKGKKSATVDLKRLIDAVQENPNYMCLAGGLFLPSVGVIGEWSPDETQVVRDIIDAREQGHSLGHHVGKSLSGYDDPNVAKYKKAYQALGRMRPGNIARVKVDQSEYLMAAFPAEMPATSLVLFVK